MLLSQFIRSKISRCLPVILATLFFVGCAIKTPVQVSEQNGRTDSAWYLQQMQQNTDNNKTTWQLLAIHALLKEGKTQPALALYKQLPQNMNEAERRELTVLNPEVKIAEKDFPAAVALLTQLNPSTLDKYQQMRYYQAVIDASQNQPSLMLFRAYIAQEPTLQGDAHQKNIDGIWQALTQLTPEQMNNMVINADENVLQGWLDLQRVWSDNRNNPDALSSGIKDWQVRYPQNPGAKALPTLLKNGQGATGGPVKIALLVPLSGQGAIFGRTIQQGFDAARNGIPAPPASPETAVPSANNTPQPEATPQPAIQPTAPATSSNNSASPVASSVGVKVYDTNSQALPQLLAQVQQDGANLIVGPLLKNNVDQLIASNTALNVLALNQPENIQNRPNICYFSLSPEDEARDAADHIWQQGHRSPLLLVPRNALGNRVVNAFSKEWQKLGGGTVLQQQFGSTAELKQGINSGAGISLTGTPVSVAQPQQTPAPGGIAMPAPLTESQITSDSPATGSVDAAYILATQDEIGLIKPMIAMRSGSRSSVQLYASSRSAQGGSGPDFLLEMEGLQFSDIPLLTGGNSPSQQQALTSVNNDYSLARLYAMGMDAWSLANHFAQIRQTPGFQITGNTGVLSADSNCSINRKLNWLQYRQGQIVSAP